MFFASSKIYAKGRPEYHRIVWAALSNHYRIVISNATLNSSEINAGYSN